MSGNSWSQAAQVVDIKRAKTWDAAAKSHEYDEENYYTRATDAKGHGVRMTIQVLPEVHTRIMRFVADDRFPDYTMPSEVVRDCIQHWLHYRSEHASDYELRDDIRAMTHRIALTEHMLRTKVEVENWANLVRILDETASVLYKAKAWNQLRDILDKFEEDNESTPEPFLGLVLDGIAKWRVKLASGEAKQPDHYT